jgi:hypothetical protein
MGKPTQPRTDQGFYSSAGVVKSECQTIRQKPFRQKGRIRFGKIAELLPNVPTDSAKVDSATTYEIIYKNTQEIPVTELVYVTECGHRPNGVCLISPSAQTMTRKVGIIASIATQKIK